MDQATVPDCAAADRQDQPVSLRLIGDVVVESGRWDEQAKIEDDIYKAVCATASVPHQESERTALPDRARVTVVLADNAFVKNLNHTFRGKDASTNVLSFPAAAEMAPPDAPENECYLGDVVLAFETIEREALDAGKTLSAHAVHLVVHGILHLLGYDHKTDADAERMETTEIEVLRRLDIANPYLDADKLGHDA